MVEDGEVQEDIGLVVVMEEVLAVVVGLEEVAEVSVAEEVLAAEAAVVPAAEVQDDKT